jgi:hypothetical protein
VPKHHIEISLPTKPIKNVDTEIVVKSGRKKLGEMRISRGSLDWLPAGAQKPRRVSWENLARLLENPSRSVRALRKLDGG